jgi:hypothetical protein
VILESIDPSSVKIRGYPETGLGWNFEVIIIEIPIDEPIIETGAKWIW